MANYKYQLEFERDQKIYGYELIDFEDNTIDVAESLSYEESKASATTGAFLQSNGEEGSKFDFLPNQYHREPVIARTITVYTDVEVDSIKFKSDDTIIPNSDVNVSVGQLEVQYDNVWIGNPKQVTIKQQKGVSMLYIKDVQLNEVFDPHVVLPTEADTTRLPKIKAWAKAGIALSMLDTLSLLLNSTEMAVTSINTLVNGGTYDDLIAAQISATNSLKVLAVYNQIIDVIRLETEKGILLINNNFDALTDFNDYLVSINKTKLTPNTLNLMRNDSAITTAVYQWYLDKVHNYE